MASPPQLAAEASSASSAASQLREESSTLSPPPPHPKTAFVSGVTTFIGSRIPSALRAAGYRVSAALPAGAAAVDGLETVLTVRGGWGEPAYLIPVSLSVAQPCSRFRVVLVGSDPDPTLPRLASALPSRPTDRRRAPRQLPRRPTPT